VTSTAVARSIAARQGQRTAFLIRLIKKPPCCKPGSLVPAFEGPALQPGVIGVKAFASKGNVRGLRAR
jgi:hypothetical protein